MKKAWLDYCCSHGNLLEANLVTLFSLSFPHNIARFICRRKHYIYLQFLLYYLGRIKALM